MNEITGVYLWESKSSSSALSSPSEASCNKHNISIESRHLNIGVDEFGYIFWINTIAYLLQYQCMIKIIDLF
jgi:hypothetical protein